jgi:hypothetical protein
LTIVKGLTTVKDMSYGWAKDADTHAQQHQANQWTHVERYLREQAYHAIDANPNSLFERDGGPEGMTASFIYARLMGHDDQIVKDGWRLRRVEPVLYLPIPERLTLTEPDPLLVMPRTAEYRLQSGFVLTHVSAEYTPPGTPHDDRWLASVLYVRYRRHIKL